MSRAWASMISRGVEYPRLAAALALALTVGLAFAIPRLHIDTSAEGFMVDDDPARLFYDRFEHEFGTDNATLVVLETDDVFRPAALQTIQRLTEDLRQVEGVVRVESLATVRRVRVSDETLETKTFIGAVVPTDRAELEALRRDALAHRVLSRNLVAPDSRAAAVLVYTDAPADDTQFNHRFVDGVDALLERARQPGITLYAVGRPLLKSTYSRFIVRDLVWFIPLSASVLVTALFFMFRTRDAVVIPLVTAGTSIVCNLGAMALLEIPLNVLTAVIPTILVTIGFTEDVHIIANYHNRLLAGAEKRAALKSAIEDTAPPMFVTTVTTIVGFATLGLSDVKMLQQFGIAAALALAGNYVVTMALLPPLVLAMRARSAKAEDVDRRLGERPLLHVLEWIGWFDTRHRIPILIVVGVVALTAALAAARIDVDTDFASYFPADTPVRARADAAARVLAGAEMFWIVVDTRQPDGIKEPETILRLDRLQAALAADGRVDKTTSIADYVLTMRREMRSESVPQEPLSREEVAQYLLLMDAPDLNSFVNADASAAVVIVRHHQRGSARLRELQQYADERAAAIFPADVTVRTTGESILTARAADYMAINEITSFTLTFVAIAVIHSALFLSFRIGLLSLIPDLIPIVVVYGVMSLLGVPLSTGTAVVATVAIGIAVDDTVHHLMTYARELDEYSHPGMALFATLRKAGRAIIGSSLALAAGFGVLTTSSFVPMQQFGAFAALAMLVALVTELFVTPALMATIRVATVWDLVQLRIDPHRLRAVPCFRGLSDWQLRKIVLMGELRTVSTGTVLTHRRAERDEIVILLSGATAPADDKLVATEPSEILILDAPSLRRLQRRFPFTARKLAANVSATRLD